ncbi:hypothetical protein BDZ89DRAFT_1051699 [Hymenopellis radicata]|nr:hypothetical protein BDZ89DRAFT_1051699 [Hymenopellis radicata]
MELYLLRVPSPSYPIPPSSALYAANSKSAIHRRLCSRGGWRILDFVQFASKRHGHAESAREFSLAFVLTGDLFCACTPTSFLTIPSAREEADILTRHKDQRQKMCPHQERRSLFGRRVGMLDLSFWRYCQTSLETAPPPSLGVLSRLREDPRSRADALFEWFVFLTYLYFDDLTVPLRTPYPPRLPWTPPLSMGSSSLKYYRVFTLLPQLLTDRDVVIVGWPSWMLVLSFVGPLRRHLDLTTGLLSLTSDNGGVYHCRVIDHLAFVDLNSRPCQLSALADIDSAVRDCSSGIWVLSLGLLWLTRENLVNLELRSL